MRAYVQVRYGDASAMELRDLPEPVAGDGEVLVRVHAAGLNPVDIKLRQGAQRAVNRLALPRVAGNELAGVVEAVGRGAERGRVGDRVCARTDVSALGAFAEYVAVPEDLVVAMPDSWDFTEAAGLPLAGGTALRAVRDELAVSDGDRVFVSAGAGGVGSFAIQLAKWRGAHVMTTASPRGEELVRSLGADEVVDHTRVRFREVLRDVDAAFDLVGGKVLVDTFAVVRRGARVVSVAGVPEPEMARKDLAAGPHLAALFWLASLGVRRQARRHGVTYRSLYTTPDAAALGELVRLGEEKQVRVVVDRVFSFADIAEALAYVEAGHAKGKVVVRLD